MSTWDFVSDGMRTRLRLSEVVAKCHASSTCNFVDDHSLDCVREGGREAGDISEMIPY